jgi:hypothetical protein
MLTRAQAVRRARQVRLNNPAFVKESIAKYEQFNAHPPKELRRIKLDLSRPLIRIGTAPEIHYLSNKEGGPMTHYVHVVDRPGTLYGHPKGKFFVLLGGSTRINEWLEH